MGGTYRGNGTICTADQCDSAGASTSCTRWTGAISSNWSDFRNWNPQTVTDNSGGSAYSVSVPTAGAAVTLDSNRTIDSLYVNAFTLGVTGGDLTIATPGGIVNRGNITVGSGRAIRAAPGVSFSI